MRTGFKPWGELVDHVYMLCSLTACLETDVPRLEGYSAYFGADPESVIYVSAAYTRNRTHGTNDDEDEIHDYTI